MNKCIICVDGGGTKTEIVAYNLKGDEITKYISGSSNLSNQVENGIKNIKAGIRHVYDEIKTTNECIFIELGLSGYGAISNKNWLIDELSNEFNTKVEIVDDVTMALYSLLKDNYDEGILVLAGTGSACFGVNHNKTLLVGGWGYLLGDEGSSYDVAISAFKSMIEAYDEGRENDELTNKILHYLGLNAVIELKQYVYKQSKKEIALLSQFIDKCANEGNLKAIELLKQAGIKLGKQVYQVYNRLNLSNVFPIGFQGSLILNSVIVNNTLKMEISRLIPQAIIIDKLERPIKGAYYLAKRHNFGIVGD